VSRGRKAYGSTQKQIEGIRFMRRMRNIHHGRRKSFGEIANIMNDNLVRYPIGAKKHFPPPCSNRWSATTIKNIIERLEGVELWERKRKVRQYLDIQQGVKLMEFIEWQRRLDSWRARRRAAVVATLFFSGIRVSELCNLQYRDMPVMHGKNMIAVRERKPFREYGEVVISEYLTFILSEYICKPKSSLKPTAWVFPNEDGKKQNRRRIGEIVKRVGRKTNFEFLHPHALRHSYASILLFDTKNPHFVKRQLGHKSTATTDIYIDSVFIHLDEDTPDSVYRLLAAVNPRRK
jgi:site-specific recombinase XerD